MPAKPRARDLGLPFPGKPGPLNAITDVAGVKVGVCTLTDPAQKMRTGVTAVLPRSDAGMPVPGWAGHYALNGNGEMTGTILKAIDAAQIEMVTALKDSTKPAFNSN